MTTYSGIMVLTAIFQCRPIHAAWDVTIEAQCIKINLAWMIMAGLNVLTDFILLIAPLPTLWRLQMPSETKLQLMGIFCIGGLYALSIQSLSLPRWPRRTWLTPLGYQCLRYLHISHPKTLRPLTRRCVMVQCRANNLVSRRDLRRHCLRLRHRLPSFDQLAVPHPHNSHRHQRSFSVLAVKVKIKAEV